MIATLATCSWRAYRPEMGVPVRITLGRPPRWFQLRYERSYEEVRLLAPPPRVFRIEDWQEFRKAYRHHLYRVTVPRMRRAFEEIGERHPAKTLVLLCFEADPADCHRGLWAAWWHEQTGEHVPELVPDGSPRPARPAQSPQPSLFGEETT
jgi:Protein of unknown function, DUF488